MSDHSAIEWTNSSWNPIRARNLKTGKIGWHCEHSTTGCEFCYAEGFNLRLGTGLPFKPGHRAEIEILLDEKMLTAPLHWKRPRKVFVCSMSDLFADFVTDEWLDHMFHVMALCPQHTFQVLTKRAERMRDYFADIEHDPLSKGCCPLPNVWLGISCERQQEADERIPLLQDTAAVVRFLSCEPLLGPINLDRVHFGDGIYMSALHGGRDTPTPWNINWVIVGGESGPNARPMHPQWARDIRDQCHAAGVAFFFKQWGSWIPCPDEAQNWGRDWFLIDRNGNADIPDDRMPMDGCGEYAARRVGKKAAGRLLDGRTWDEFPDVVNEGDGIDAARKANDANKTTRPPA